MAPALTSCRSFLASRLAGYKKRAPYEFVDELPPMRPASCFKRKLREPYWASIAREGGKCEFNRPIPPEKAESAEWSRP